MALLWDSIETPRDRRKGPILASRASRAQVAHPARPTSTWIAVIELAGRTTNGGELWAITMSRQGSMEQRRLSYRHSLLQAKRAMLVNLAAIGSVKSAYYRALGKGAAAMHVWTAEVEG